MVGCLTKIHKSLILRITEEAFPSYIDGWLEMKKWNKQFLAVLDKGDDDISEIQTLKKSTKWYQQYNMIWVWIRNCAW